MSALSDDELKLLARRHCFSGYSLLNAGPWSLQNPPVCTRHHCMDWNFIGKMRPRPNKWRIEMNPDGKVSVTLSVCLLHTHTLLPSVCLLLSLSSECV